MAVPDAAADAIGRANRSWFARSPSNAAPGHTPSANAVSPTGEVLQGKFSLDADELAVALKVAF